MKLQSISDLAGYALFKLHGRLLDLRGAYQDLPVQRRIMHISAVLVCGGLLFATSAHAQQSEGLAGMAQSAGDQADRVKQSFGKIFAALGFAAAGAGGWNGYRKGKEGEQSHIKGGQIVGPIVAGAVLGAIGYVMIKAGETVGVHRGDLGAVPG